MAVTTVSAHDVAEELRRRLPGLAVKKQHKLLYYCQGYHLAAFGHPLFAESVSAWDMGPVVGQLWHQEREGERPTRRVDLDEGQLNTVGYVLSRYGGLSGTELERLTHQEPPWLEADKERRLSGRQRIEPEIMARYFRSIDEDAGEDDDALPPRDPDALHEWLSGAPERRRGDGQVDSMEELRRRRSSV